MTAGMESPYSRRYMEWAFLLYAAIIYFAYAYLAFNEHFDKNGYFYFISFMLVGFVYNFLWYWSTKIVKSKDELFFLVLMWDVVYMVVFYFTPVMLFNVKLDRWGIIGMITMIAGLLLMKIGK